MAKGPIVTPEVEVFIVSFYKKHPKWSAKKVRNEVSLLLHENNPKLPSEWPSLSTVQKVLAIARKPHDNPQDKPWSTATLDSYPIPPEALASVLKVWKFRKESGQDFTVREAKWAARFSTIYKDTESLFYCAYQYAGKELVYEFIGRDFDSTELDSLLVSSPEGTNNFKSYVGMVTLDKTEIKKGIKEGGKS